MSCIYLALPVLLQINISVFLVVYFKNYVSVNIIKTVVAAVDQ